MVNLGIKEHLSGFKAEEYTARIHEMTVEELQDEEQTLRREYKGSVAGAVVTAALAFHTVGTSLIGTALDGLSAHLDKEKLELIHQEMNAWQVLCTTHTVLGDFLAPVAGHLALATFADEIGMGLEHAMSIASPVAEVLAEGATEDMWEGAEHIKEAVVHVVEGQGMISKRTAQLLLKAEWYSGRRRSRKDSKRRSIVAMGKGR